MYKRTSFPQGNSVQDQTSGCANYDMASRRQGTYWIGTISRDQGWVPVLPDGVAYLRGQTERGEGGFEHEQIFFITTKKQSCQSLIKLWAPIVGHWELTKSAAAEDYVWKLDSRISEPYEFGKRPIRRNSATDWDAIKASAMDGKLDDIPADVYVRYYRTLCCIAADNSQPIAIVRECVVYWGPTGSGKSRRAWSEAGDAAYCKDPRSKFWCGYKNQEHVIFDEFRGGIDVSHILRWTDRYPVTVEIKGASRPLRATRLWFTSNIHPREWYPTLDVDTVEALLRRFEIVKIE